MPRDAIPTDSSARFDFNKAAQDLVRDHPGLKRDTVFINLDTSERHGSLRARLKAQLSRAFRKTLEKPLQRAARSNAGTASAIRRRGGLNAIAMTPDRRFNLFTDALQDKTFAFYHEAAHLLVPAATPDTPNQSEYFGKLFDYPYSKAEGAADAYAAMRLLQEDANTDFTRAVLNRATDVIHLDAPEYMTVFVLDAVARDAAALAKLSPAETIIAADAYAQRYTPTRAELDKMRADFAPLKGKLCEAGRDNTAPLQQLAAIALDPKSSAHTFYVANRILGAFMGKILSGPQWEDTARKLHEVEKIITLNKLFPAAGVGTNAFPTFARPA